MLPACQTAIVEYLYRLVQELRTSYAFFTTGCLKYNQADGRAIVHFFSKNPCTILRGYAMIRASSDVMTNVGKTTLKQSDGRLAQLVERIPYKD